MSTENTTPTTPIPPDPATDATREHPPGPPERGTPHGTHGELHGVLAEFGSPGELVKAARQVRDAGYSEFDCYSSFPVHGIDDAMGIKRTVLPLLVFAGGIAGTLGGLFLQWWMNAWDWPWNVSGKPAWSLPANVPIAYETTILLAVLTTFFGMWILNKLPQVWHPFFKSERFQQATDDGFFLGIEARDARFDLARTTALLEKAGATAIDEVHLDADPERRSMPRWIWGFIIATTVMAMIPFALIAKARVSKSSEPHWHVFADMDFQPRAKSDGAFDDFPDGRANRGMIPGTVARGLLKDDDPAFFYGLADGAWITGLPDRVQVNAATLARGREGYDIYCAPCHGYDGQGGGTVPKRVELSGKAWIPANLVGPPMVTIPNGQLYNTIANGRGTMLGYAAQIPVEDRWAIVLYVRALQRSQHPSPSDPR
jgi:mono/diheme cytochrome c family protein